MGLLKRKQEKRKKPPIDEKSDGVQHFFDGYFMELRERGRAYFDKAIEENADQFKAELAATVAKVNTELKDHLAHQIDTQIAENGKSMKEAQDVVLQSLNHGTQAFQQQQKQLTDALQKNISYQESAIGTMFEDNKAQIEAMKNAQNVALQSLNNSVLALQQQQQQMSVALQQSLAAQQELLVKGFEENMASIIEHYLVGALGDQYDMKAQLPSIIKQMETNKQTIVDDMKL